MWREQPPGSGATSVPCLQSIAGLWLGSLTGSYLHSREVLEELIQLYCGSREFAWYVKYIPSKIVLFLLSLLYSILHSNLDIGAATVVNTSAG